MEQRWMRLVNLIEFWSFLPLLLFFKAFKQYTKMASAQEPEGLVSEAPKQIKMPLCRKQRVLILTDVGSESNCFNF